MASPRFGLPDQAIASLCEVFSRHPAIQKVVIYGSRAKGNFRNGSDIDLTLIAPPMELSELLQIENEIDDLLLPYKVDLSIFHNIENENLLQHIDRIGKEFL